MDNPIELSRNRQIEDESFPPPSHLESLFGSVLFPTS